MEKKTIEILKEAGWYKERKIDIKEIVEFLELRGFNIHEKAKRFIEEFGMLDIKSPTWATLEELKSSNFTACDKHTTDIYEVFDGVLDSTDSEQFEEDAEEKLVIVGLACNENIYLMISESGKVYCDTGKLGDNVEEAWDTLLNVGRSPIAWQFL